MPLLNPDVADRAPSDPELTTYDEEHAITYMRVLDADAEGADLREVARIVLHIDPDREPDRARQAFESRRTVLEEQGLLQQFHLSQSAWATTDMILAASRLPCGRRCTPARPRWRQSPGVTR